MEEGASASFVDDVAADAARYRPNKIHVKKGMARVLFYN